MKIKRTPRLKYIALTLLTVTCLGILVAVIPYNTAYADPITVGGGVPPVKKFGSADPPAFASGCSFWSLITGGPLAAFVGCLMALVYYIISVIVGFLIILAVWFVELALAFNASITQLPAVQIGWRIVRDIANLGFVLGIVVIAFATILRSQTYGMKQILWKFIVMAILINFSLSIAGVLLDFAGVITQFFLDRISQQGSAGFGEALMSAFSASKLLEVNANIDNVGAFNDFGKTTIINIITLAFYALFVGLILVCLIALAIMLFIRFLYIGILLIIMPLTWLFWVFPNLSQHFSQWWNNFIKWTMFAPASMFFIYLSVYTMLAQSQYLEKLAAELQRNQASASVELKQLALFSTNPGLVLGQAALMIGLLFASLMIANKIGITGAAAAQKGAEAFSRGLGGWTWRKGVRTAGYLASPSSKLGAMGKRGKGFGAKIAGGLYTVQNTLSKVPGLKQLGRAYRAPGKHQNLYQSTFAAAMYGSGLWKKQGGIKDWECQTAGCGDIVRSVKKPGAPCKNGHTANWKEA